MNGKVDELLAALRQRVTFMGHVVCLAHDIQTPEQLLRFDVLPQASFNASCSLDPDGRTAVVVNAGVFFISRDIFWRLLSHPEVWPEIGDPSLETDVPAIRDYFTNALDLVWQGGTTDDLTEVVPKCPVRRAYADWLDFLACSFLIIHELGHALHGHLAFAGGLRKLREVGDETDGAVVMDPLTRQALEYDADLFATNMVLRLPNAPDALLGRTDERAKQIGRAVDILRAVGTHFHLWCAGAKDVDMHRYDRAHPPPRVRQQAVYVTMGWFLEAHGVRSEDIGLGGELGNLERNYLLLTGRKTFLDQVLGRLTDPHGANVVGRWTEIHPSVNKRAWIPIPAPGTNPRQ